MNNLPATPDEPSPLARHDVAIAAKRYAEPRRLGEDSVRYAVAGSVDITAGAS